MPEKGGMICRSPESGRFTPAMSHRRTGMEVMAPPPTRAGVSLPTMPSQRDSCDFIPSFFLSQFPVLQLAKQPLAHPSSHPALCHGPRWRSQPGQFPPMPLSTAHPPPHPSQLMAQIQSTKQPQHKLEQGFQQAIGSSRARSRLLGKAGAAKLRLSSCSILAWSEATPSATITPLHKPPLQAFQ